MKSIFYVCDRCGKPAAAVSVMKISLHMQKGSSPVEAKEYDFCPSCFTVIQNAFLDVLKYKSNTDAKPNSSVSIETVKPDAAKPDPEILLPEKSTDKCVKTISLKPRDTARPENKNGILLTRGPITKQDKKEILRLFVENGLSPEQIAEKMHRLPTAVNRVIHFASKTGELGRMYDEFLVSQSADKVKPDADEAASEVQPDVVSAGIPSAGTDVILKNSPVTEIVSVPEKPPKNPDEQPEADALARSLNERAKDQILVKEEVKNERAKTPVKEETKPVRGMAVKKEKPISDVPAKAPESQPKGNRLGRDIGSGITNGGILKDGYVSPPKIQVIGGKRYDIGCILALARAGWPVGKIADEKQYDTGIVKAVMKKYL